MKEGIQHQDFDAIYGRTPTLRQLRPRIAADCRETSAMLCDDSWRNLADSVCGKLAADFRVGWRRGFGGI